MFVCTRRERTASGKGKRNPRPTGAGDGRAGHDVFYTHMIKERLNTLK